MTNQLPTLFGLPMVFMDSRVAEPVWVLASWGAVTVRFVRTELDRIEYRMVFEVEEEAHET